MKSLTRISAWPFFPLWFLLVVGFIGTAQSGVAQEAGPADQLYNEGNQLEAKGDHAGALAKYEAGLRKAEELQDRRAQAKNRLGIGYVKMVQGDLSQAMAAFRMASQLAEAAQEKSLLARALARMGEIEGAQGQYVEAQEHYRRALQISEEENDRKSIHLTLFNLGNLYLTQSDYPQALKYYQSALKMSEELGNRRASASALNNIGLIYKNQGLYPQAVEHHQRALKIREERGDKRDIATTLLNIGAVFDDQAAYGKAIECTELALSVGEALGDKGVMAAALDNLGIVYKNQGSYDKAVVYHQKALDMHEGLGDKRRMATALNNLGVTYESQGSYDAAITCHQRALKIREDLKDKTGMATALHNIGLVYHNRGSYAEAAVYYQRALKINEDLGNKSKVMGTLNNLGALYESQGADDQALIYYQRALKMSEELGDKRGLAMALTNMGNVYEHRRSYGEAVAYFERALKITEAIGDKHGMARALGNIGLMYQSQGNYEKGLAYGQRALKISREIQAKRSMAHALNGIGRAYAKLQQYPQAMEASQQALALGEEIKAPDIVALARYNLAGAYERSRQPMLALQHYQQAVEQIEKVRAQASSDEGKTGLLAGSLDVYENLVRFLCQRAAENPAAGYGQQAFEYAERAKARTLLDLLTESKAEIRKKISSELLEQERPILAKISHLQRKLWEHNSKKGAEESIKELDRALANAYQEHDRLKLEIRQRSPEYAAMVYPEPVKFAQAQKFLDERTALLEYVLGEESSYLFVLTQDHFEIYALKKRAVIESRAEKFSKLLAAAPSAYSNLAYLDEGHELYNLLIRPAQALLRGKSSLILVPDGNLSLMSFAALLTEPVEASAQVQFKALPYLIKKYELSCIQSVSVLASLATSKNRDALDKKALVVFADPIYEEEKKRRPSSRATGAPLAGVYRSGIRLARIEYSGMEAEKIAGIYGADATVYLREQATEERVKSEPLNQYRYVHFAAHGIVDPERPGFSAIVLGNEDKEDGFLQLPEVFNLDLDAELVVLSACQSGVGPRVRGEGLIGLARGFMYAGARSVLASLWKIEDSPATANFMYQFYRTLENKNKAASLRKTQLAFINSEKHSHPFYWAAFVLIGN